MKEGKKEKKKERKHEIKKKRNMLPSEVGI
jgi:hypothetical protein